MQPAGRTRSLTRALTGAAMAIGAVIAVGAQPPGHAQAATEVIPYTPPKSSYACGSNYFPSTDKWEITWGRQYNETAAPTFTMASNGGLKAVNYGPIDADEQDPDFHWWYLSRDEVNSGATRTYYFKDGTVRSATASVGGDGCPYVDWAESMDPCAANYFPASDMWEITWGRQFSDTDGDPTFTMDSFGGLIALSGAPVPGYMTGHEWRWLYPTPAKVTNGWVVTYDFADTTRITATVSADGDGCPLVQWVTGVNPNVAESTVVVNELDTGVNKVWHFDDAESDAAPKDDDGNGEFVDGPTPLPAGNGSVELSVQDSSEGQEFWGAIAGGTRLDHLTELGYSTYQVGSPTLALQFSVDYDDTDANESWQGRLVYEPANNGTPSASAWDDWNALSGKWWASGEPGRSTCPSTAPCEWSEILAAFPNAQIHPSLTQVVVKAGKGWANPFTGNADALITGVHDGAGNITKTTYDFEHLAPSDPTCVTTASTTITDLVQFDNTDIRSAGHFELQAGAAHVYTDDASSNAKVAGYVNAPSPKLGASFDVDWTGTGTPPSAQIVLSDGSILVGEAIYGNDYWAVNGSPAAGYAPQIGGGFGSQYHGTPAEWQTAMDANGVTVAQIGFSLGSGVQADGLLASVTAGCHTVDFPEPFVDTSHTKTCGSTSISLRNVSKWVYPLSTSIDGDPPFDALPADARVPSAFRGPTVNNAGVFQDVTKSKTFSFPEDSGTHTVEYVVAAGTESDLYTGLPVGTPTTVTVETDCIPNIPDFNPVDPARVFDTRPAEPQGLVSVPKAKIGPSNTLEVKVTDLPGGLVPSASDVGAVSLNVTAVDSIFEGWVKVAPCGAPAATVSNVNFFDGETEANAVLTKVSADGKICLTSSQPTNLVVDVNGWFKRGPGFNPVDPARLFDTRSAEPAGLVSVPKVKLSPSGVLEVKVTDLPGGLVPASGVEAVSLNVTAVDSNFEGWVKVAPCGAPAATVSNVNFFDGETEANAVLTKVSADGKICLTSSQPTNLVVDVNGWFSDYAS